MSKLKSIDDIKASWNGIECPRDGQRYQHYKGGVYEIVATGHFEDSEAPCVIYRSLEKNIVWVRTAKNFLEFVEHEGRLQPRFKPIDQVHDE